VKPENHPEKSIMDLNFSDNQDDAIVEKSQTRDMTLQVTASDSSIPLALIVPYNDFVQVITATAQGAVLIRTMRGGVGFVLQPASIEQQTNLLSLTSIGDIPVIVRRQRTEQGRIIVKDRHLPAQTIEKALTDQGVMHAKRCGFRSNTRFTPKETVILTFESGIPLPQAVRMGDEMFEVLSYTAQPPQCYKCGRVGHVSKYCFSSAVRCYRCGGPHLKTQCVSDSAVCQVCRGNHDTLRCSTRSRFRRTSMLSTHFETPDPPLILSVMESSISSTPTDKLATTQEPSVTEITATSNTPTLSSNLVETACQTEKQIPTFRDIATQTSEEAPFVDGACQTTMDITPKTEMKPLDLFSPLDKVTVVKEKDTQTCWTFPMLSTRQEHDISVRIATGIKKLFMLACDDSEEPRQDDPGQIIFAAAYTILATMKNHHYKSLDHFFGRDIKWHLSTKQQQIFHFRYEKLYYNYFLVRHSFQQMPCVEYSCSVHNDAHHPSPFSRLSLP
jgi:hypothetical protein